jgi:hypothetical protein
MKRDFGRTRETSATSRVRGWRRWTRESQRATQTTSRTDPSTDSTRPTGRYSLEKISSRNVTSAMIVEVVKNRKKLIASMYFASTIVPARPVYGSCVRRPTYSTFAGSPPRYADGVITFTA